jgi:hypothetical protein
VSHRIALSRNPLARDDVKGQPDCHDATQKTFPLAKITGQAEHCTADPITGRLQHEGGGEWDKTSEVLEVHGASR